MWGVGGVGGFFILRGNLGLVRPHSSWYYIETISTDPPSAVTRVPA